jgi:hypothetical protein
MLERQLGMGIVGQAISYILMTSGARVVANVIVGVLHRRGGRMLQGLCGRHASTACGQNPDQRNHKEEHRYSTGQMPHTETPLFGALVCLICCLLAVGQTINQYEQR